MMPRTGLSRMLPATTLSQNTGPAVPVAERQCPGSCSWEAPHGGPCPVDPPGRRCHACDQYRDDVGELPDSLPLCAQCAKAHRMGYRCGEDAAALQDRAAERIATLTADHRRVWRSRAFALRDQLEIVLRSAGDVTAQKSRGFGFPRQPLDALQEACMRAAEVIEDGVECESDPR